MFATLIALVLPCALAVLPSDIDSAHEVRALSPRDAQTGRLVRLRGTVTFSAHPHTSFYLRDKTGGVRVEWARADRELKAGDAVDLLGVAAPGPFFPRVRAWWVTVMPGGRDRLSNPERFNLTTDEAHYLDAQWVIVEAVVQNAWVPPGLPWLKVDLARGRGTAVAYLPLPLDPAVKRVVAMRGAVVRVRGVWERAAGGPDPPRLLVTDVDEFAVLEPPAPVDALPAVAARELNQPRPDPISARLPVRIAGTVTLNQGGRHFYVQDDTGVVSVRFRETVNVLPGQRVAAVGFPRPAGTSDPPLVENADPLPPTPARAVEGLPLPPPVGATVADAAAGRVEGRVVRFTGEVRASGVQGTWPTLTVLADGLTFTVVMVEPIGPVEDGSTVEVLGVATRQQFGGFGWHTFAVFTRLSGLKVLAGPPRSAAPEAWWTGRRVAYLTAGFMGLFVFGGATVAALRVQVRRATALAQKRAEEKRQLEGQLDRASKLEAVGRVAGGVAHDFNNILTVINGCAETLDDGPADDPRRAATLADIRRAGRLATALTRLLLAFSRSRRAEAHPLDVNAVVSDAEPILARLLGARTVLCVAPDPGLPPALADTGFLLQILINLAANAGEAMPDGGTFTLATATPEPGWVRLTAIDTGVGMSPEVQARAFERGFTTKAAGTGTGLATVADAVAALGGRIRFRSEPGRGTEFEIDLPAAAPALGPGSAPAPAVDQPTPARPDDTPIPSAPGRRAAAPVALLVEDDDAVRAYVRHVLEAAGLAVLVAAEPEEALRVLAAHAGPIDLLVTDVMLPGRCGRELAADVRALRPDVRVLFVSGYSADEVMPDCDASVDFLHKPFAPHDLTERVARLLGQSSGSE